LEFSHETAAVARVEWRVGKEGKTVPKEFVDELRGSGEMN